ncbi:DUF397 domain-containing protein [Streptomyces sodiiphilus]
MEETAPAAHQLVWGKSSYSGAEGGECIEVAASPKTLHVRDSKDTTGPILSFGAAEWTTFVDFAARS